MADIMLKKETWCHSSHSLGRMLANYNISEQVELNKGLLKRCAHNTENH